MNTSSETSAAQPPPCTVSALFTLFSTIGLSSFRRVSGWTHRALVERRAWLTETEFAAVLALARITPGASVVNLAALIGHRLMGLIGAVVVVLGLLGGPTLIAITLAVLYRRFADAVILDTVLTGTAAAAVGMLFSMGLNSTSHIVRAGLASPRRVAPEVGSIGIVVTVFVLVGLLRLPTVAHCADPRTVQHSTGGVGRSGAAAHRCLPRYSLRRSPCTTRSRNASLRLCSQCRAAPGPGALLTTLIGWQAAGWSGALLVSLAFFLPSSVLVDVAAHFWNRRRGSPWHAAVENGSVPIAGGLVLAGGIAIIRSGGNEIPSPGQRPAW